MQNYETGRDQYTYLQYGLTVQVNRINGEKINCETKVLGPQSKSIDATKQSP